MEEFASLWSYQENIDELKQKLLYTTLELEAVKAELVRGNTELVKQLLQSLKIACQERDETKELLQKLLNKIMNSNDPQIFKAMNPLIPNCIDHVQHHHQSPLMVPTNANSSIAESTSLSETYKRSSSPVDSLFDTISSPEFSNFSVEAPFVQDYDKNVQKVEEVTLVMERMIRGKTLPQKGSLLEAVVEAGPLLQTLLLAGPLPRWRNPPSPKTLHISSTMTTFDHITATQKLNIENNNRLLKSPMMMLKQSQPYAKMACGSSSQMMVGGGDNDGGGVVYFGDVNFGSNCQGRMVAACPSASNLSTIGKKQRLH